MVVRLTNCFGPWQHPEKAVPRWITRTLRGLPLPVWGDGRQIRDWMHTDDACEALRLLEAKGSPGEVYNVAPEGSQITNFQMASRIANSAGSQEDSVYLTNYDRPNHDRRYAINSEKIRKLGWAPKEDLSSRLTQTVEWYAANRAWWKSRLDQAEDLYDDSAPRQTTGRR
jgi:dTDP-glucose 4,6-dehydratase